MYSLNDTKSIGAAPNIIASFEQSSGNKWTVPIGLGIRKTINIGEVQVHFDIETYYSAITPDDVVGTEWNYRFYMIPAAPSALFKWMNQQFPSPERGGQRLSRTPATPRPDLAASSCTKRRDSECA